MVYRGTSYTLYGSKDGRVEKFSFMEKTGGGSSLVETEPVKTFEIHWKRIEDFPEVASESHTYSLYGYDPIYTGMVTPLGKQVVDFLKKDEELCVYRVTTYMANAPTPLSKEMIGLPALGPDYIHPEMILNLETVIEVPEIGFSWVNEYGDSGRDSIIYFKGQEVYRASCYGNGLVSELQYPTGTFVLMVQLEM